MKQKNKKNLKVKKKNGIKTRRRFQKKKNKKTIWFQNTYILYMYISCPLNIFYNIYSFWYLYKRNLGESELNSPSRPIKLSCFDIFLILKNK